MTFIVMGHYVAIPCGYIAEQTFWLGPLLAWINLFVMPGFAVLSGYLSKGSLTEARVGRLLVFVLFPYILSKLVYWIWFSLTFRMVGWFDPFDAYSNSLGLEWYLIVLVQWRLAIALLSPFNKWALIGSAVAVGLVSGNWVPNSTALALHRGCSFFPFFVLGYTVDLAYWREAVTRSTLCQGVLRISFVAVLALFFCFPGLARLFMNNTLGDLSYDYAATVPVEMSAVKIMPTGLAPVLAPMQRANCGSEWVFSFVHRLIRYEIGLFLLFGFLAWIPSSSTMARYGRHTMYPYLLHPWIFQLWLMPLFNRHLLTFVGTLGTFSSGGYVWLASVLLAPFLTLLLSTAPVRFIARYMIEPTWLGGLLLSQPQQKAGKDAQGEPVPIPKASV
jgi:fucose 4-O-acetylase-like acetyltransferase